MPIMPTGMHVTLCFRSILEGIELLYLERIHVGAKTNCPIAIPLSQHANETDLPDRAMGFDTQLSQLTLDIACRFTELKAQLRAAMQCVAPSNQLRNIKDGL
jgi:hypothetical protein